MIQRLWRKRLKRRFWQQVVRKRKGAVALQKLWRKFWKRKVKRLIQLILCQWGLLRSSMNVSAATHRYIVLYDGVCRLCAGVVTFVIKRDAAARISFCAIQSSAAAPLLAAAGVCPADALRSFIFYDVGANRAFRRSAAALEIARHLGPPWSWLGYAVAWVPALLRDAVYDCIASRRYAWFGKSQEGEHCLAPTRRILARFVDADELRAALRGEGEKKDA